VSHAARALATSEGSDRTVTDIQEQNPAASEDAGTAAKSRAKTGKTPSLAAMKLPDLQQLASGMGISTTKVKKSDLIAAIQAARAGGSPAANGASGSKGANGRPARDRQAGDQPMLTDVPAANGSAAAPAATVAADGAREQAAAAPSDASSAAPSAAPSGGESPASGTAEDEPQRPSRRERERRNQNAQGANQNAQGANQNAQGANQNGAQQANNQANQNGAQQANNQSGQNRDGQNRDGQNRTEAGGFDDDGEGGRRRGRRYRDRRGRNRDRGPGGGNSDLEPTVSEDDVLIPVAGILDAVEEKNTWFIRTGGYFATSDDVYVANSYVRRYNLRRGDAVTGAIRQQREGERREKFNPLVRLDTVNGQDPEQSKQRVEFTKLTPLYPQERLRLETEPHILTTRVIDLVMPIGKGQRALIVSPPKAGKTSVLQAIANAIAVNNPEVHLMVVLVDERPEEVTDMQRSVKGEVIASTFDRKPQDHTMVAELSIERAKRLVEMGHDVVVLLDSITRLGRAYNLAAPASGRILSGGVDSTALYPPKRFLGAARNIENGGSLTIIATALVETGSAGDTVIFEEFKGTGNAELKLDRKIADKRVFPAVDVDQSSTRKEEILLSPDELAVTIKLRRVLHALEPQQAIDLLMDRLRKTRTNYEFLMQIAKTTPGQE